MGERVKLVGLDFGTTTSSAVVASAEVTCNSVTGRRELGPIEQEYASPAVFTPLTDDRLDESKLGEYLDAWLAHVDRSPIFGGGAMITGLAAQRANAATLAQQIRRRLKDAVIAVGGDPHLESWLSFMGNCADLSRTHADRTFLNLDIGGGTTNLAFGRGGEVLSTGSYFIGARHVQVSPGSYRIVRLSRYARALFEHLRIEKHERDELSEPEVRTIVDWYLHVLEETICGRGDEPNNSVVALHREAKVDVPSPTGDLAITLSGGVGQLVYAAQQGGGYPSTTAFGDLGIDLARRLAEAPFWKKHLEAFQPTAMGRATVFGLLRYNTQVSGSTIYLTNARLLPLPDLIILGSVGVTSSLDEIKRLLGLAAQVPAGACLRLDLDRSGLEEVRGLAAKLYQALSESEIVSPVPLVLLMRENLGKVFGQYATRWGKLPHALIVIDELDRRDGQFAHLGALTDGVIPVSIYGMNA
jgi:ethanolamine utilization protein EutA